MHGAHTMLVLVLTALLAVTSTGCAPPAPRAGEPHRPSSSVPVSRQRVTDAFPEGRAQSAVEFWHDNPDLTPQVLDGAALLLDSAGTGPSSIPLPQGRADASLVLVLTCERPAAYGLSLIVDEAAEPLTSTTGPSCGGPTIAVFTTPPLDLSHTAAAIDVELPKDTAYYLAVYTTARDAVLPDTGPRLARSLLDTAGVAPH